MKKFVIHYMINNLEISPDYRDGYYLDDAISLLERDHPNQDITSFLHKADPLGKSIFSMLLEKGHLISMDDEDPEGKHYLHQAITREAVETLDKILAAYD